MKTLVLWTLLIAAALPLTACHWHHHHHRFSDGYYSRDRAQNDLKILDQAGKSRQS